MRTKTKKVCTMNCGFAVGDTRKREDMMADCEDCDTVTLPHPDDIAVDRFAAQMKAKLAAARAKGRGGWDDPARCTVEHLSELLREHVEKGDPVDVANFSMMLQQRGSGIRAARPDPDVHGAHMLKHINVAMNGTTHCGSFSLGECAMVDRLFKGPTGKHVYVAMLYLWDPSFNDSAVIANWFHDGGADQVVVKLVLHDSFNGDRDGKTEDGARAIEVTFTMKDATR